MKLFLFFVFISFFFDSKASNSINGEEIEGLVNEWLQKNNQSGNVKLLKSLKYPSCKNEKSYSLKGKNKKKFNVITLKNPKSAGAVINEDDLIYVKKSVVIKDNLVAEKSKIVGKKLKNSISSGRALYHSNFEKDWLIEKNSIIVIENRVGSITIKEEGIALDNADFMGKIRVKNIKSGKIINGYAKNEKKVVLKTKQN